MKVEIYSDIACPWCYIGERRFARALSAFEQADEVEVIFRPYQLDPSLSDAPRPLKEHLQEKFGPRVDVMTRRTAAAAAQEGLDLRFDEIARRDGGFDVELVDLAEVDLPLFDEPKHPRRRQYEHAHTKAWSEIVDRADAYVFVTPEYDHTPPASLVNALQHLAQEWAYKPAGFVSYGGVSGGTRGVQVTKQIAVALKMMPIPEAVNIPFFTQHLDREAGVFAPGDVQEKAGGKMLDELQKWAAALKPLRAEAVAAREAA